MSHERCGCFAVVRIHSFDLMMVGGRLMTDLHRRKRFLGKTDCLPLYPTTYSKVDDVHNYKTRKHYNSHVFSVIPFVRCSANGCKLSSTNP